MAHQSFRKDVLDKTLELAAANGGQITTNNVSIGLFIQTRKDHKRLLNTLSELAREGKISRVRQGVYSQPQAINHVPPDKREVMWRLLKIQKRITLDYMVELAGVSRDYAREWLAMLVKHEVVKKIEQPGAKAVWLLLHDVVDMPIMDDRAARLRLLRKKKKETIAARLDAIDAAVTDVRHILANLEEE